MGFLTDIPPVKEIGNNYNKAMRISEILIQAVLNKVSLLRILYFQINP